MSDLNQIGSQDNWTCWLCDKPVDPNVSVNSDFGPSADGYFASKAKKGAATPERLAHRSCNTMKGKIAPVIKWPEDLLVFDAAPIIETVERLAKKGGREAVGRCANQEDASHAKDWLLDRLGRLAPSIGFQIEITPGAGQFLLKLSSN